MSLKIEAFGQLVTTEEGIAPTLDVGGSAGAGHLSGCRGPAESSRPEPPCLLTVPTVEDDIDNADADAALDEARDKGTVSLSELKRQLGF